MRRSIIILLIALFIGPGAGVSSATCYSEPCCEPATRQCAGPPWSGGCEYFTCGELFTLGGLRGGWSDTNLSLVVHSEGPVTLWVTWVRPDGGDNLGTRELTLPAGNYQRSFLSVIRNVYDDKWSTKVGGFWIEWQACGDSLLYLDHWNSRNVTERDGGYGQRSFLHNALLCPDYPTDRSVGGVCGAGEISRYFIPGCYELPIPVGTDYVRVQLMSQSEDEWQVISIDGEEYYVPPLIPEDPQLLKFAFAPTSELTTVCVGKVNPWSGGMDIGEGCVLSSFEGISAENFERLSLPVRPLIIIEGLTR